MPDNEAARWKARYERAQAAYQKQQSELARVQARLEAAEKIIAGQTDDVAKAERAKARIDREATRKRRFQERVAASVAARALRDKP
jgi:hypothetical protein